MHDKTKLVRTWLVSGWFKFMLWNCHGLNFELKGMHLLHNDMRSLELLIVIVLSHP
jgi:hypothetical protein